MTDIAPDDHRRVEGGVMIEPVIIDDIICNEGEGRGSLSICPLPSHPLIVVGSPTSSTDLGQFTLTVAQAKALAGTLLHFALHIEARSHIDVVESKVGARRRK